MATSRKIIGSIIKFHRKKNNMTLQELGDTVNRDRQYMWRVENGRINTTMDLIDEIIRGLKTNHTEFYNHSKIKSTK